MGVGKSSVDVIGLYVLAVLSRKCRRNEVERGGYYGCIVTRDSSTSMGVFQGHSTCCRSNKVGSRSDGLTLSKKAI